MHTNLKIGGKYPLGEIIHESFKIWENAHKYKDWGEIPAGSWAILWEIKHRTLRLWRNWLIVMWTCWEIQTTWKGVGGKHKDLYFARHFRFESKTLCKNSKTSFDKWIRDNLKFWNVFWRQRKYLDRFNASSKIQQKPGLLLQLLSFWDKALCQNRTKCSPGTRHCHDDTSETDVAP